MRRAYTARMPQMTFARIELTPAAKAKVEEISDHRGMTQFAILSRLVEWFAVQDDKLQAVVMGHYPKEIQADVAKLLLKDVTRQTR